MSKRKIRDPHPGRMEELSPQPPVRFHKKPAHSRYAAPPGRPKTLPTESDSDVNGNGRRIAWPEKDERPGSADNDDYDSDFESSDTDDIYKAEFDYGEDKSDNSNIELDYGNGISLQTTDQYRSQFDRFTTVNWRVSNPNLNIPECLLNSKKKMASDIFEIITKQNDNSDQEKIACRFAFDDCMVKHILFKVPVFESYLHDDKSVVGKLYSFSVIIEVNGEWKEKSSQFENGFVTFTCSCVDSFCIQSKPKTLKQVINGTGFKINTGNDGEIIIKFNDERKELTYKIERPTIDNIKDKLPTWNPKLVIAVSAKIYLKFTRESLNIPIQLSFPGFGSKLKIPGTEPRLIGFKKGQPSLLETIGEPDGDKMHFKLKGYDGAALALVHVKDVCYMKTVLMKELEIFYGRQIECNIILFVTGKTNCQMYFVAHCVMPDEKQSVKQTTTNNGARCIYESDKLYLNPLQRIRIQVGGKIKGAPGCSNNFFLTFLCESKNNYINFPVAIKAACDTPYAIIEFALDNINCKGVVSSFHFEPYWPYKSFYTDTKRF